MGVSLTEFTVVFLVALVLFGPEQLPVLARTLGKLSGQVRKTSDSLRREFYNSVYPPSQDIRSALGTEMQSLRALKAEILSPPTGSLGTTSRGAEYRAAEPPPAESPPAESPPAELLGYPAPASPNTDHPPDPESASPRASNS